jgi:hypothetical protein
MTLYALIHNAATIQRDVVLAWRRLAGQGREGDRVSLLGGRAQTLKGSGTLVVPGLLPGEHRWVRMTLGGDKAEREAGVEFAEMVGNVAVNGFAVVARSAPRGEVSAYVLDRAISIYTRLAALKVRQADELAEQARKIRQRKVSDAAYLKFAQEASQSQLELAKMFGGRLGGRDQFGFGATHRSMIEALDRRDIDGVQSHHGAFLESLDAVLTSLDRQAGDLGDVCQNLRWQAELFAQKRLVRLPAAHRVVRESLAFVTAFGDRKVTFRDYPEAMRAMLDGLREAVDALRNRDLPSLLEAIENALDDPKALQRRHWEYLAAISARLAS